MSHHNTNRAASSSSTPTTATGFNGASAPVLPNVSWTSVGSQLKQLATASPLLTAGLSLIAAGGVFLAYQQSQQSRRAAAARRRILRYVKSEFELRHLEILRYCFEGNAWNHFDLATVERIYTTFKSLLSDPRRGILPLSDIISVYKKSGLNDDIVAIACAKFWDIDGNGQVDFIELIERLNLVVYGSNEAKLREYFKVFDLDNSHFISKAEMQEVLTAMSADANVRSAAAAIQQSKIVNDIFRRADSNRDGQISLQEFLKLGEVEGLSFSFNKDFVRAFGIEWDGITAQRAQ